MTLKTEIFTGNNDADLKARMDGWFAAHPEAWVVKFAVWSSGTIFKRHNVAILYGIKREMERKVE